MIKKQGKGYWISADVLRKFQEREKQIKELRREFGDVLDIRRKERFMLKAVLRRIAKLSNINDNLSIKNLAKHLLTKRV